jgi:hypothetical protein
VAIIISSSYNKRKMRHPDPSAYAKKFSGKYSHRTIEGGVGHNLPQKHRKLLPRLS